MSVLTRVARPAAVIVAAAVAAAAVVMSVSVADAATGDGSPTDANIAYVGRWDPPAATTVGYWSAPYIRAAFTGRTIKVKLRDSANVYVSIDGGPDVFHAGVRGTVNLTPTPLAEGTHQIRLAFRGGPAFQGFVLDPGAQTVPPKVSKQLIEWVGDSITHGALNAKTTLDSYGWVASERLGVEHATIARSGGCLVAYDGCFALSDAYWKKGIDQTANWNTSRYDVSAVVVNMGTNDAGHGVTPALFGATHLKFFRDLRAAHPNATLYAFQSFRMRYVAELKATVKAMNDAGDRNVHYIPTEGWLTAADYVDGGHPNEQGNAKIATRLLPILRANLAAPTDATVYKLVNRHSGKVLAIPGGSTTNGATAVQATDNGSAAQRWRTVTTGGYAKLVNVASGGTLDVFAKSLADGAAVVQWTDNGGANQLWQLVPA